MLHGIVVWGATAISALVLAGFLAGVKNRDLSFWMAWSFLIPPLVFWLLLLPKRKGERPRQPTLDQIDRERDSLL